jgi:ribonuclease T
MNTDASQNNPPKVECFISVDIETSGPVPEAYSLLSIGACAVLLNHDSGTLDTFYCTMKPLKGAGSDPNALQVTGFSLDDLVRTGKEPTEAMKAFEQWIMATSGQATPVFVGLNASFDWSFINYYFHRFLGRNPFGFSALDIKSLYMGATGCSWAGTKSSQITKALGISHDKMAHQALEDAQAQAELFRSVRQLAERRGIQL